MTVALSKLFKKIPNEIGMRHTNLIERFKEAQLSLHPAAVNDGYNGAVALKKGLQALLKQTSPQ